jgi:hypothetical protein
MGLAQNRGSPSGSIGDAGQVGQGGDKRHYRYDDDAKDNGKIHPGVLFVVIIVGLNSHDFLTIKFMGPALGAAGLCLLSSVGRRPKKPIQPNEKNDCLLLARLM